MTYSRLYSSVPVVRLCTCEVWCKVQRLKTSWKPNCCTGSSLLYMECFQTQLLCVISTHYATHDAFLSYLLCQQLSDFPRLEPEPQQLHLQSNAAFLPIHAGRSDCSWPAALQHVGHGEDSQFCLSTQIKLKKTKERQVHLDLHTAWIVKGQEITNELQLDAQIIQRWHFLKRPGFCFHLQHERWNKWLNLLSDHTSHDSLRKCEQSIH